MNLIVNVTTSWGIGAEGDQPFYIKEDLAFFKKMTLGKTIIMGRKTFNALPGQAPLKNRNNIVITRSSFEKTNVSTFSSLEKCLDYLKETRDENIFIIGGGSIYAQFLRYCETAFVTKILKDSKADVYFPNLDRLENWTLVKRSSYKKENGVFFSFCEYNNNTVELY